jgi:hypothetical protein
LCVRKRVRQVRLAACKIFARRGALFAVGAHFNALAPVGRGGVDAAMMQQAIEY